MFTVDFPLLNFIVNLQFAEDILKNENVSTPLWGFEPQTSS